MTNDCIDSLRAVTHTFRLAAGHNDRLISRKLMIHKDVSNDDLANFIAKAVKLHMPDKVKANCIVVMNDNCICFHQDDVYYLLPAKIISLAVTNDSNDVSVVCDYGDKKITLEDFIEL